MMFPKAHIEKAYGSSVQNRDYVFKEGEKWSKDKRRETNLSDTHEIAKGMKPKALQKILGHKYLQTIMDLYCHVLDDTMRDEMSLVLEMV